jgi:hypothetical protein
VLRNAPADELHYRGNEANARTRAEHDHRSARVIRELTEGCDVHGAARVRGDRAAILPPRRILCQAVPLLAPRTTSANSAASFRPPPMTRPPHAAGRVTYCPVSGARLSRPAPSPGRGSRGRASAGTVPSHPGGTFQSGGWNISDLPPRLMSAQQTSVSPWVTAPAVEPAGRDPRLLLLPFVRSRPLRRDTSAPASGRTVVPRECSGCGQAVAEHYSEKRGPVARPIG